MGNKKAKTVRMEDLEVGDFLPEWDATVKRVSVRNLAQTNSKYGVVVTLDLHGGGRADTHTLIDGFDTEIEVER